MPKKSGHKYPLCKLCGEEYEANGAAGMAKHWKAKHPTEWAEYKDRVIRPSLQKANKAWKAKAEKRKRKRRKQVQAAAADPSTESGPDAPEEEDMVIEKPPSNAMPQQVYAMSAVIPPDGEEEDMDVIGALIPMSDIRTGSTALKPVRTNDMSEASVFAFVPKVFSFSSVLLHTAWEVTVREFGWDPKMDMGKWLDTYLFLTMEKMGVKLAAYTIEPPQGGNGNGHQERNAVSPPV